MTGADWAAPAAAPDEIAALKERIVDLAVSLYGSHPRPCSGELKAAVDRLTERIKPRLMTPEERFPLEGALISHEIPRGAKVYTVGQGRVQLKADRRDILDKAKARAISLAVPWDVVGYEPRRGDNIVIHGVCEAIPIEDLAALLDGREALTQPDQSARQGSENSSLRPPGPSAAGVVVSEPRRARAMST